MVKFGILCIHYIKIVPETFYEDRLNSLRTKEYKNVYTQKGFVYTFIENFKFTIIKRNNVV